MDNEDVLIKPGKKEKKKNKKMNRQYLQTYQIYNNQEGKLR